VATGIWELRQGRIRQLTDLEDLAE
jgi:hypothetical protein